MADSVKVLVVFYSMYGNVAKLARAEAEGVIFGTPTRYGNMCAQMKQFIDRTGSLWEKGALENKVAGVFTSASTLHGG